jgi:hypothetical protein
MSDLDDFDPTDKQAEILRVLFRAVDAGEWPTIDDIKARLSYGPSVTKQAITCSLRILERRGAVELKYGEHKGKYKHGLRCWVTPTPAAYRRFRVTGAL